MSVAIEQYEMLLPNIGNVKVFVQGTRSPKEVAILTVHDLGHDHSMYFDFVGHLQMKRIRDRTVWIHVDVPGQTNGSPDLPIDYNFPTMQQIGEDLVHVLDHLKVKEIVCFGSGAGANIVARFATSHADRVLGVCLIDCNAYTAGFLETFDKYKMPKYSMGDAGDHSVLFPKVNTKNMKKFADAYLKRTSIIESLNKIHDCPALLMSGHKSLINRSMRNMHHSLLKHYKDKTKVEYIEVMGAESVLEEAPEKLAESFQYFLQGFGLISSIPMHLLTKPPARMRTMSMEDYDVPKLRPRTHSSVGSATSPVNLASSPPRYASIPENNALAANE